MSAEKVPDYHTLTTYSTHTHTGFRTYYQNSDDEETCHKTSGTSVALLTLTKESMPHFSSPTMIHHSFRVHQSQAEDQADIF